MLIGKPPKIPYSAVTPRKAYLNRRRFLAGCLGLTVGTAGVFIVLSQPVVAGGGRKLPARQSPFSTTETATPLKDDIGKRPFITIGFASLLLMIPLAITSTAAWIRRLGGKRWQLLHRLIHLIGAGSVIHYYWLVKSDIRLPVQYGAILGVILAYRWFALIAKRRTRHVPMLPQPQQTV
jgi:hypothetical protein